MKLQIGTITLLAALLAGCGGSTPSSPPADLEVDEQSLEFEMSDTPLTPDTPGTDAPAGADEPAGEAGDKTPATDDVGEPSDSGAASTEEPASPQ